MPKNIQVSACDWVVASALENIDWCAAAEANNCTPAVVESDETENVSEDTAWMQEALSTVLANQETMYNEMMASFTSLNEKIDSLEFMDDEDFKTVQRKNGTGDYILPE